MMEMMETMKAPTTIVELNMKDRHTLMFRVLTHIGQNPAGTHTSEMYLESYVYEGLFPDAEAGRYVIRDIAIAAKNAGLLMDVSLKQGKGFMVKVTSAGMKYYVILGEALPDEVKRSAKFNYRDIIQIYEEYVRNG